ncbi:uncharacterized protein LOC123358716 [Mauremys mutica]|uniref:uncharacterized protein LOC123358716 n=1 Tax=Mauremys mutica TaxID=74926 RepID=UPI001D13F42B|nr:uncharacterized protein LOC123358716 [Mauremys mutica]
MRHSHDYVFPCSYITEYTDWVLGKWREGAAGWRSRRPRAPSSVQQRALPGAAAPLRPWRGGSPGLSARRQGGGSCLLPPRRRRRLPAIGGLVPERLDAVGSKVSVSSQPSTGVGKALGSVPPCPGEKDPCKSRNPLKALAFNSKRRPHTSMHEQINTKFIKRHGPTLSFPKCLSGLVRGFKETEEDGCRGNILTFSICWRKLNE